MQPQPSNVTSNNVLHRRQGIPHNSHPARPWPKQTLPAFSRKRVTVVVGPNRLQVLNLNSSHLRPQNIALRCTRKPFHGILPAYHQQQSKARHVLATPGGRDHSWKWQGSHHVWPQPDHRAEDSHWGGTGRIPVAGKQQTSQAARS